MNRRRKSNQPGRLGAASKARSLRHPRPYFMAVLAAVVHYLTIVGVLACLVVFVMQPQLDNAYVLVGSVGVSILTWIVAYFKRLAAVCPLCKGTPLYNCGANPHPAAFRLRPFNHGVSAILTLLFTHHFRCMYCGSHYDLMRQPRDYRHQHDDMDD